MNININERIRQEFIELLTFNNYPEPQNTRKPPVNMKSENKPKTNAEEYKNALLPLNEPKKNITNEKMLSNAPKLKKDKSEEFSIQEEEMMFIPINDFEAIEEKPLYNIEMPLYQGEQNKEMFLKFAKFYFFLHI